MSNPTSNFGWQMPTPVDLVTDLPADFEVFGQAVDSTLADLKGGTSGQILSKNSNTDMDFVWITNDQGDITGVTATSPLTGGGTSGDITVGIQSASTSQSGAVQLSDSTSTTSSVLAATPTAVKSAYDLAASAYAPAFTNNFYAGKNKVINGDFGIWQRGTSFSLSSSAAYTADRWYANCANTVTVSQQTFTPGTAPVAGYESQYFLRFNRTARPTAFDDYFINRIEDVRTFAGQTVTMSFWAKTNSGTTTLSGGYIEQNFGSGGSSTVYTGGTAPLTLTTSWQRFSAVVTMPSISGKTIGTGSYVTFNFAMANSVGTSAVYDIWGCQLEAGSVATPFATASGNSKQGELAMCQRYYFRMTGSSAGYFSLDQSAAARQTTIADESFVLPVTMRTIPNAIEYGGTQYLETNYGSGAQRTITSITLDSPSSTSRVGVQLAVASGLTAGTRYIWYFANNSSAYFGVSAEL